MRAQLSSTRKSKYFKTAFDAAIHGSFRSNGHEDILRRRKTKTSSLRDILHVKSSGILAFSDQIYFRSWRKTPKVVHSRPNVLGRV